jgi:putative membrane protein
MARHEHWSVSIMETSIGQIVGGLQSGLPVLVGHFVAALALLVLGAFCYVRITPFNERQLIAENNVAAACVLVGTLIALAIPLTATLATSGSVIDIVIWGLVAVIIQLATFAAVSLFLHDLRKMVLQDNVAAALTLAGLQIAVALLNAGVMAA